MIKSIIPVNQADGCRAEWWMESRGRWGCPSQLPLMALDGLVGKRVGIRGLIKLYKGVAEIVIERREQIVEEP